MPRRIVVTALVVALALTSCGGCGRQDQPVSATDPFCRPAKARSVVALVDDRGAIPANNVVPVVSTAARDYRDLLALVSMVSRALSPDDVQRLDNAKPASRSQVRAIRIGIADVTGLSRPNRPRAVTVGIPRDRIAAAVTTLYAAALRRAGVTVRTRTVADAPAALLALGNRRIGLVALPLGSLSGAVTAPAGPADLHQRLQAVATAGMRRSIAIGAPTQVTDQSVLAVAPSAASMLGVHTVGGLAQRCTGKGLVVGASSTDRAAAEALASTYQLSITDLGAGSALTALREGRATAVVVAAKELPMPRG